MSVDVTREDGIAVVTVNRPEAMNALSSAVLDDLAGRLAELASDPDIRAVVLTGAGDRAFIAGADIKEMSAKSVFEAQAYAGTGQRCAAMLEEMRPATIAAINGFALGGGCELALACDIRFASTSAKLGQPEINLGLIPGWGGTQRLARTAGLGFAKELVLTGRTVAADEALARGLVNAVFEPAELMERTLAVARTIAARSPLALAHAKEACNRALHGDHATNLAYETNLFAMLFATDDAREGMAAFVEKREPRFSGR